MIAPALLSGTDVSSPETTTEWIMFGLPLAVAAGAVWYGIKYGTEKFRDRMVEMQLSKPPVSDPFDSDFVPEEDKLEDKSDSEPEPIKSGDISLEDAMDRLLSEFP